MWNLAAVQAHFIVHALPPSSTLVIVPEASRWAGPSGTARRWSGDWDRWCHPFSTSVDGGTYRTPNGDDVSRVVHNLCHRRICGTRITSAAHGSWPARPNGIDVSSARSGSRIAEGIDERCAKSNPPLNKPHPAVAASARTDVGSATQPRSPDRRHLCLHASTASAMEAALWGWRL